MRRPRAAAWRPTPRAVRHHAPPRWYRGAIVRGGWKGFLPVVPCRARAALSRAPRTAPATALALTALALAGCGGGSRQDAHEPAGTFAMKVGARFPAAQSIARPSRFVMAVRNTGTETVTNVAVTIDSFDYVENYPDLAANQRPVWVDRTGARGGPPSARGKPGDQPARRRSDRLRQHLGARPARARTCADIPLASGPGEGRHLHGPLRGLGGARRQGQSAARIASRHSRQVRRLHQTGARPQTRQPEHRTGRSPGLTYPLARNRAGPTRRGAGAGEAKHPSGFGPLSKDRGPDFASG